MPPPFESESVDAPAGCLYAIATPIGNLEDMTFRAVRVLKEVDTIAAEDTRHTGRLLQHFAIDTPQISYHDRNRAQRTPELRDRLLAGENIALVSDAGVPGICDPGYELVKAAAAAGIPVVPIPGANAAATALCAAGLPADRFAFEGFLSTKNKLRRERLENLKAETRTMVLYEAPHRLRQTLDDLAATLGGDRPLCIARELTKLHEEFWRGSLNEAIAHFATVEPRGEFVLVLAGAVAAPPELSDAELLDRLQALMAEGRSRSQASRELAKHSQRNRQDIYRLALSLDERQH